MEPARKSEEQFRDEVRAMTSRKSHCVPQEEVVERVNRYVRGWVNYFHLHNSTREFVRQRVCVGQRAANWQEICLPGKICDVVAACPDLPIGVKIRTCCRHFVLPRCSP